MHPTAQLKRQEEDPYHRVSVGTGAVCILSWCEELVFRFRVVLVEKT